MALAEEIYWLPTYQTRENSDLPILTPEQLIERLSNRSVVTVSEMDDTLWQHIQTARANGKLVLCMGAGTIDDWLRERLSAETSAPQN
jgi:UDP-N-acetylmuramate-alanine ligase